MLSKKLQVSLFFVGISVLGAGVVLAQGQTVQNDAAVPNAENAGNESAAEENLSPEEMAERSQAILASLDEASQSVGRMLREARQANDVVKMLCLDDKLSQIDVARRSAADRAESLGAAAGAGNQDRAAHDFAVIGALGDRTATLSAEANQCVGKEQGQVGVSTLEVVVDPSIPLTDTTLLPAPSFISAMPQLASPTF